MYDGIKLDEYSYDRLRPEIKELVDEVLTSAALSIRAEVILRIRRKMFLMKLGSPFKDEEVHLKMNDDLKFKEFCKEYDDWLTAGINNPSETHRVMLSKGNLLRCRGIFDMFVHFKEKGREADE